MEHVKKFLASTWGQRIVQYKRYIAVGILLLVIIYINVGGSSTATTTTTTYTVASGDIRNTIKVLGETHILNQQTLVFNQGGKVTKLYVKVGDKVKAGQLLAEVDKKDLDNSLSQGALSVQNARLNYTKLLTQYTDADKLKAQNDVTSAQNTITIAQKQLQDLLDVQGNVLQVNGDQVQNNIVTTQNIIKDSKSILKSVDDIFYFSPTDGFSNATRYISAKDPSYKDTTQLYYQKAQQSLQDLQSQLNSIVGTTTTLQSIQTIQAKEKSFLSTLSDMTDAALSAVNNSLAGADLTQSTLNSRISTLNSTNSKVMGYVSTVNNNASSLKSSATDIQAKKNEISNDQAQLMLSQQNLQQINDGANGTDKALQVNAIREGQLNLQKLRQQVSDYEIRATFDGNVDSVAFKVGDNVTSADGIVVSNPDEYQVDVLVDQIDVVNISKGQLAEISFDAYPGYVLTGEIAEVDPTATVTAGVVSYTAKINLSKTDKTIYDSMTVSVDIIRQEKNNVLVVPTIALQSLSGSGRNAGGRSGRQNLQGGLSGGMMGGFTGGLAGSGRQNGSGRQMSGWNQAFGGTGSRMGTGTRKMVMIMKNGQVTNKMVIVGISDDVNTEIVSGLSLGDKIVLNGSLSASKKSGTSSSSSSSFGASSRGGSSSMRGLGGGGGFGG